MDTIDEVCDRILNSGSLWRSVDDGLPADAIYFSAPLDLSVNNDLAVAAIVSAKGRSRFSSNLIAKQRTLTGIAPSSLDDCEVPAHNNIIFPRRDPPAPKATMDDFSTVEASLIAAEMRKKQTAAISSTTVAQLSEADDTCENILEDLGSLRKRMGAKLRVGGTASTLNPRVDGNGGAQPPLPLEKIPSVICNSSSTTVGGGGLLASCYGKMSASDVQQARELIQFSVQNNVAVQQHASYAREGRLQAANSSPAAGTQAKTNASSPPTAVASAPKAGPGAAVEQSAAAQPSHHDALVASKIQSELVEQRAVLERIAKQQAEQHQIQLVLQQKWKETDRADRKEEARRASEQSKAEVKVSAQPPVNLPAPTKRITHEAPPVIVKTVTIDSSDVQPKRDAALVSNALERERELMNAERKAWQGMLKTQHEEHQKQLEQAKNAAKESDAVQKALMRDTAKQVFDNMQLQQRLSTDMKEFHVETQKKQISAIREFLRPVHSSVTAAATLGKKPAHEAKSSSNRPKPSQQDPPHSPALETSLQAPSTDNTGKVESRKAPHLVDNATSPLSLRNQSSPRASAVQTSPLHPQHQRQFDEESTVTHALPFDSEFVPNGSSHDVSLRPVLLLTTGTPADDRVEDDLTFCVEMCVASFAQLTSETAARPTTRKVLDQLTMEEAVVLRDARRRLEKLQRFSLQQPGYDNTDERVIHSIVGEAAETMLFSALSTGLVHELIAEDVRTRVAQADSVDRSEGDGSSKQAPVFSVGEFQGIAAKEIQEILESCLLEHANVTTNENIKLFAPSRSKLEKSPQKRPPGGGIWESAVVEEFMQHIMAKSPTKPKTGAISAKSEGGTKDEQHVLVPIPHEVVRATSSSADDALNNAADNRPAGGDGKSTETVVKVGDNVGLLHLPNCTIRVVLDWNGGAPHQQPSAPTHPNAIQSATQTLNSEPILIAAGPNISPPALSDDDIVKRVFQLVMQQQQQQQPNIDNPSSVSGGVGAVELAHTAADGRGSQPGIVDAPRATAPTVEVGVGTPITQLPTLPAPHAPRIDSQIVDAEFTSRLKVMEQESAIRAMCEDTCLYTKSIIMKLLVKKSAAAVTTSIAPIPAEKQRVVDDAGAAQPQQQQQAESAKVVPVTEAVAPTTTAVQAPALVPLMPTTAPDAAAPGARGDNVTNFIVEWFKVLDEDQSRHKHHDITKLNEDMRQMVGLGKRDAVPVVPPLTREEVVRRAMEAGANGSSMDYSSTHPSSFMEDGRHRFVEPHVRRRNPDSTNTTETTIFNTSDGTTSAHSTSATSVASTRTSSGTSTTVSSLDSDELDNVIRQHMQQWPTAAMRQ